MVAPRKTQQLRKTKLVRGDGMAGWLVPRSGKQAGQVYRLEHINVIGADPEQCTIVLDEEHVSSRHAQIAQREGEWVVTDLGATNGTSVGNIQLARGGRHGPLVDGDILAFGTLKVTFKCA